MEIAVQTQESRRISRLHTVTVCVLIVLGSLFTFWPEFVLDDILGGQNVLLGDRMRLLAEYPKRGGFFFLLGFLAIFGRWFQRVMSAPIVLDRK